MSEDNLRDFQNIGIWKQTARLLNDLVEKKGLSIAKTVHQIIMAAHRRNFPDGKV
jgi:hypothetical protein